MSLLTSRRPSFLRGFNTMPCHPFAHTLSHYEKGSRVEARARRQEEGTAMQLEALSVFFPSDTRTAG